MTSPAASLGRGQPPPSPNGTPTPSRPRQPRAQADPFAEDSGDISLSLPASEAPLAAPQLRSREVSTPVPQRLLGKGLWPQHHGTQRSASAHPPATESDMGERRHLAGEGWGPPSPSTSPPLQAGGPDSSSSTPTVSSRRQLTRSRSLNVKIPSVDLSQGPRDVSSATTATTPHSSLGRPGAAPSTHSPRPPPLIDDDTATRMSRWVQDIIVCNFDLERGPVVERRAGGKRWGPGVKENVAFSSFPDTSLFTEGDIQFSFKIRNVPPEPAALAYPEPPSPTSERHEPVIQRTRDQALSRDKAAEYRAWDERGREWLYGFVWFHQRRDRGIARGYMQKSVVILTQLPFPALWSEVLKRLAPAFFQHGYSAIEVACHGIASWPAPKPDVTLELPLLSNVINVKLPDETDNPQLGRSETILASLPPSTPLRAFASFLPSLWSLWECLVLAEPILVIAPDPRTCSEIVWWLRELVRPIPLAGDFRPYLHIHDHDFSLLVNSNKPQAGVVVGVTNPFFRNAASHWPNVISISGPKRPSHAKGIKPGIPEPPEGFLTRRHRGISKDRALLKRLETLVAQGKLDDPEGNAALRTHFQQLTEKFLVPLNRYFQTLVPPRSSTPSGANTPNASGRPGELSQLGPKLNLHARSLGVVPKALSLSALRPFSLPTFLNHLKTHGPNPLNFKNRGLQTKSRVESDFYASFCMGSCFAGWLAARVESLGIAVATSMAGNRLAGGLGTATPNLPPAGLEPESASEASEGLSARSSVETGDVETLRPVDEVVFPASPPIPSPETPKPPARALEALSMAES